ncbi:MAG: class I SAM-dependent methyltransferase [Bacteroidota bacterium]
MISKIKHLINEFNAEKEYKKYIPEIHKTTENIDSNELVDFMFHPDWKRFFWMMQIPSEIKFLLGKVYQLKPKVVLEIGTKSGGTLFLFTKVASDDAKIVSIDFPDGQCGGYSKSRASFYKMFPTKNQSLDLIRGDSHAEETKEMLIDKLGDRKIDFAFIDGDHSYEGVKQDFEMYSTLVRPGGLVAFHDNKPSKENSWSGVIKFWEEVKHTHKTEEFFGKEDSTWGGIGIIYL